MSHELLKEPFDLHGGGYDLVFPHHENEIAQSESLMPEPLMANFWVHGGLLQFDNRKMSKSLGNFEPLQRLLDRHDPQAIRLLFLQTGYRKPMNFTEDSIEGATTGLQRLLASYDALRTAPASAGGASAEGSIAPYTARFGAALDDDMNTSGAVSVLFDLSADSQRLIAAGAGAAAAAFMHESMTLLGISPSARTHRPVHVQTETVTARLIVEGKLTSLEIEGPANAGQFLPVDTVERLQGDLGPLVTLGADTAEAVAKVIEARHVAKMQRDFGLADKFRDALKNLGVSLTDVKKDRVTWTVVGG